MPAVFVHGVPTTHRLWVPVVERLGRDDVIAVDLPGFASPVPDGFAATKEAYVDWLIARIEAIGEPVDIVGHDWGCLLTMRLVSLRPDLVRSWAAGGGPIDAGYEWHALAKIWQTPGAGEDWFANLDRAAAERRLLEDGVPPREAAEIPSLVDETMGACILKLYRSALTVGADWQPALAGITAPGLVLWGVQDRPVPMTHGDTLARDTGARIVKLDAGHYFPLQCPNEVAAALTAHWAI